MKRLIIPILALCALFVACKNPGGGDGDDYTVTFDKNGGTTEASPRTITVAPPATTIDQLPTPPTRTDHAFIGWNTRADGFGDVFSALTTVTANITVYAQWLYVPPGSFVVTFDRNGGDTDADPVSKVVTPPAKTIDELPTPPTRADYDFDGWNTNANGTGDAFTTFTQVTKNITVYAQWKLPPQPGELIPAEIVDFEKDTVGKTYESAKGGSSPTVAVVADPVHAGEKSLRVNSTDYNQAAVVPIKLPYTLQSYKNLTFRFNYASGNLSNQEVLVYAAKSAATFAQYGFGNPADSQHAQFAANLVGKVSPDYSAANQWQNFTITITNPSSAISDIKGDIYLAIGINHNSSITYLLDDITFTIKDGFVPPPGPPPAPTPSSTGAVTSKIYRNLFKEFGKSDQEIDAKVNAAYNQLFVNGTADQKIFIEVGSDMAYIYTADTDDVRSEGMSYGMMMCVQMNDKTRFDKLWKWAKTNMYHNRQSAAAERRGFFAWKRNVNGTGGDENCAPDGEFYFVTSLLFASVRWGDGTDIFNYGKEARHILYDMIHRSGNESATPPMFRLSDHNGKGKYMPVFQPYGSNYAFTDPSYHLPAFYEIWAIEIENGAAYWAEIWGSEAAAKTDAQFWRNAAQASRAFFPTTVNSTTGLGPDYANFDGSPTGGEHQDFRYDAWRIAMNIGMDYSWWANDPWQIEQSNRIQSFFHSKGVDSYGSLWNLNGNGPLQNGADHSPGLVACNAVASLAANHAIAWDFIENFWNTSTTEGKYRYYDGCLYMMGLLHVSGKFKAYLSNGSTPPPPPPQTPAISPTTATFDKNTAGANYKDIAVTLSNLGSQSLSNIKNGNTTITQGNNTYTLSGSTVTIKTAYLAQQAVGTTTLTFTFSNGTTRNLAITVRDTTGGGPIGEAGTEYDFTSDPSVNVDYADRPGTADLNATVANGVLKVEKTATNHSTPKLILDFDLGATTLGSYSQLQFVMRAASGDLNNKSFMADVSTNGTTWTAIGTVSTGTFATTFANFNIPIGTSSVTGPIKVRFYLDNAPAYTYEIQSIKFVP